MSFNLYSVLPEQDKIVLTNYITEYGVEDKYFIGVKEWLKPWGVNKIKLYHLLGDRLIYSIPYEYNTPDNVIIQALEDLMWDSYHRKFINTCIDMIAEIERNDLISSIKFTSLKQGLFSPRSVFKNSLPETIKLDWDSEKKPVVLSKGMKVIKAILKLIKYITVDDSEKQRKMLANYEDFRLAHSRILNTKKITGDLCFSIHPMDFLTMSDNSYNWTSCMNWTDHEGRNYATGGCYRVGSTEMMFSNCVICCYLKTKEAYWFMPDKREEEDYMWNNKKWRQLFYVTKDIIIGGKSYPYENEEITIKVLEELRKLALENLKWSYSFGPEEYFDMKGIYGEDGFDLARVKNNNKEIYKTGNILFATRGMYNDMVNDHSRKFICVRNKVHSNKIINISGKSHCLCCNSEVIYEADYPEEYNNRYENTGSVICYSCKDKYFTCSNCGESYTYKPNFLKLGDKQYCGYCQNHMKKCPSGNGEMLFTYNMTDNSYVRAESLVVGHRYPNIYEVEVDESNLGSALRNYDEYNREYVALFMSEKHRQELVEQGKIIKSTQLSKRIPFKLYYPWSRAEEFWIMVEPINTETKKYFYENLENYLDEEA